VKQCHHRYHKALNPNPISLPPFVGWAIPASVLLICDL